MFVIEEPSYVMYLTCIIFISATCTLDEPDKHFSHKLLLYFAFFVKWVKRLTYIKKFIFRYQDLVEIYSVSAETIINDAFSFSENV